MGKADEISGTVAQKSEGKNFEITKALIAIYACAKLCPCDTHYDDVILKFFVFLFFLILS